MKLVDIYQDMNEKLTLHAPYWIWEKHWVYRRYKSTLGPIETIALYKQELVQEFFLHSRDQAIKKLRKK